MLTSLQQVDRFPSREGSLLLTSETLFSPTITIREFLILALFVSIDTLYIRDEINARKVFFPSSSAPDVGKALKFFAVSVFLHKACHLLCSL